MIDNGSGSWIDHARVELDQRRGAPADLHDRAEHVLPDRRGEHRVDLREDQLRVGNRVLGEQDLVERAAAYSLAEGVVVEAAVDPNEPADAVEREAEPELDAGEAGGEAEEQRPGVRRARDLGVEDAGGDDAHAEQLELGDTGVAAGLGVDVQEAAPADHARHVDADAEAVREDHREGDVERADIAVHEPDRELYAECVGGERDRPERPRDRGHGPQRDLGRLARVQPQREIHPVDAYAGDREPRTQRDLEAHSGRDAQAGAVGQGDSEGHLEARLEIAEHRAEEVVERGPGEHERQPVGPHPESQLELPVDLVDVEREGDARQLEADAARLAEHHARRVGGACERRSEPARRQRLAGREGVAHEGLAGPHHDAELLGQVGVCADGERPPSADDPAPSRSPPEPWAG